MNRKLYNKVYYSQNKDKILEKMKSKVYCEICKTEVSKVNFPRHMRTKKHKNLQRAEDKAEEEHQRMLKEHKYKELLWNHALKHGLLPPTVTYMLDKIAKEKAKNKAQYK